MTGILVAAGVLALSAHPTSGAARELAGAGPTERQQGGQADSALTPAMIALGDSVFHGKVGGGICFACHGPTAKGMPGLAPDLTDDKWLHGDGSYAFIHLIVEKGIAKPKEAGAPMLPKGGSPLSPAQVTAVSAYVYSLSHKK